MEIVINFSGGKDSSAMLAFICEKWPDVTKHVVMADTGWEHKDAVEWSTKIVSMFGLKLNVVRNPNKTFLTMVEKRGKFPSNGQRQCTSDLKRGPIQTWIRQNISDPLIINCMGMRAEESPARSKLKKLKRSNMTNSKRTVWDYHPILNWKETEILDYLSLKQIPLHPVYKYLRRFSCRVCIFMGKKDLKAVQENDPEAIEIISSLEDKINFTMKNEGSIKTIINS